MKTYHWKNPEKNIIYLITNLENLRVYVGLTTHSITERMYGHMSYVNSNSNDMLIDVIMRCQGVIKYVYDNKQTGGFFVNRDGIKLFSVQVIDFGANIIDLCRKEINWIKKYKSYIGEYGTQYGYNQTRGGEVPFVGRDHPLYKEVNPSKLKDLIISGYNAREIAEEINISFGTVGIKTKEFWGKTLPESRKSFGGERSFEERTRRRMSESASARGFSEKWRASASANRKGLGNVNYILIDESTLKSLVCSGLTVAGIAEILQINYSTVYDKMIEFWGKHSIIDLRRELGVERRKDVHPQYIEIDREKLKILILKGFNALEITEKLKLNSTMTVYRRIYEFWGKNLRDLQKEWNIKTIILMFSFVNSENTCTKLSSA